MLESLPFILVVGTLLGFLSGIGIGGGSLLILWLTIVLEVPQDVARGINLLFFIPSALIACLFRWKQGVLDWKTVLPGILSGCLTAGVFSWVSLHLETEILRMLFGILLILTGLRELRYRPRRNADHERG